MKLLLLIFSLMLSFVTNAKKNIYPEDTNGDLIVDKIKSKPVYCSFLLKCKLRFLPKYNFRIVKSDYQLQS